jgi:hypothetical protein
MRGAFVQLVGRKAEGLGRVGTLEVLWSKLWTWPLMKDGIGQLSLASRGRRSHTLAPTYLSGCPYPFLRLCLFGGVQNRQHKA